MQADGKVMLDQSTTGLVYRPARPNPLRGGASASSLHDNTHTREPKVGHVVLAELK